MSLRRFATPLALVILFGSCDDPTGPEKAREAARLRIVSGDGQEATAGAELGQPLAVRVADERDRPVREQRVEWRVLGGGGTLAAATVLTDSAGEARNRWTLGTTAADTQRVEARVVNEAGAVVAADTFTAVAKADAPAAVAVVGQATRTGGAGQPLADSLAVRVTDRHGNPVPNATVAWSAAGGGTLSPAQAATDAQGIARAQWTLGLWLDSAQVARAFASPTLSAAFTATTGVPAGARLEKPSGDAQSGRVAARLAEPLVARLVTMDGRPVRGAVVTWAISPGAGTLTPRSTRTNEQGEVAADWVTGTAAGTFAVTASVEGASPASFTARATPDAPAAIERAGGDAQRGEAGHALMDLLSVRVTDRFGNPVPGAAVVWDATSGGGSVAPAAVETDSAGRGRAQWTLGLCLDCPQVATAWASPALSAAFTATATTPAGARLVKVSGDAQVDTVGQALPQPLVVRFETLAGQPVRGALVTWTVSDSTGTVTARSARTDGAGQAAADWRLGTAARSAAVTVSVPDATPVSFTARAVPSAPAGILALGPSLFSGAAGQPVADSVEVFVNDEYGNPVPGAAVVWSASDGGSLSSAETRTDAHGTSRNQWTMGPRVDSAQTVTAWASPSVAATFRGMAGIPAGSRVVVASGNAQTAPVNTTLGQPLAVRVEGPTGQPLRGALVRWSVPEGEGGVMPGESRTDAAGLATTAWRLGTAAGTRVAMAVVEGLDMAVFTATAVAGTPAELVKVSGDGQTGETAAFLPQPITVRLVDAYGNPVSGRTVQFVAGSTTGGSVSPASVDTRADGLASATWRLGGTVGEQRAGASYASLPQAVFTATATQNPIQVTPLPGTRVTDHVSLVVRVNHPEEILGVTATVQGTTYTLSPGDGWRGPISLAGQPRDTVDVVIRARTATQVLIRVVPYMHDAAPTLAVQAPPQGAVARPGIRVQATCTDDDPNGCTYLAVSTPEGVLATGTSSLDTEVSLAAYTAVTLTFTARDSARRTVTARREVFVEGSPRWVEAVSAGRWMRHTDGTRALYIDSAAAGFSIRTRPLPSGAAEVLYQAPRTRTIGRAFLTPRGAIWVDRDSGTINWRVRESRDGALLDHGIPSSAASLEVEGRYAIWSRGSGLARLDVQTGAEVQINGAANFGNRVAANGDVAYWEAGTYQVYRYRGGTSTRLTSTADSLRNVYPVTDGVNVVYLKLSPTVSNAYHVAMVGADGVEVVLTPRLTGDPRQDVDYQAAGGWVAYVKPGPSGAGQVWRRAPDGTETQVSNSSASSRIVELGPDGSLIITSGARRFASRPGGALVDVGVGRTSENAPTFFVGGQAYTALGRSLFRVEF